MTSLSVFRDVPIAQKLEGSLLKIYRQDDSSVKMFLAYKGRSRSFQGLRFFYMFQLTAWAVSPAECLCCWKGFSLFTELPRAEQ